MDGAFFLILAAIPFKVLSLGGGPVALGLVPALGAVTYIVLTPLAGRLSDRVGRTWLCLAGNTILIGFTFLAYRSGELSLLLLAIPLMGVGKALYWPGVQAAVGDLSAGGRLERNIGFFNVAWSSGKSLGFLACGLLLGAFGFRTTFLCGAAMVVLAFVLLPRGRLVRPRRPAGDVEGEQIAAAEVPEPLRRTFRHMAWLANLAAYGAGGVLAHHLPKWFAEIGWHEGRFGLFLGAIFLVQTVAFVLLAGTLRFTYSARFLLIPQLLAGIGLLTLPWLQTLGEFLLLAPVLGFTFGIAYAASIFYSLHTRTERGFYAGIHESLIGVGGFLPPLLGGLLAGWSGWLGAPYLLASVFVMLSMLVQVFLLRRLKTPEPASGQTRS